MILLGTLVEYPPTGGYLNHNVSVVFGMEGVSHLLNLWVVAAKQLQGGIYIPYSLEL